MQQSITSSAQQKLELYDIYGMYYNPWWLQSWFFIACGITCVSILIYGFYRWYLRKYAYKKTYWDHAYIQLKELEKKYKGSENSLNEKYVQNFYYILTFIIKEYIIKRFAMPMPGATDAEFLKLLQDYETVIPSWIHQDLKIIFNDVVFIKFANASTTRDCMVRALQLSFKIVEKTKPNITENNY